MGYKYKIEEEQLREAVARSTSWAGLLRELGITHSGSQQRHYQNRVASLGIDTSHFTGQAWNRGKRRPKVPADQRLVLLPLTETRRIESRILRRALDSLDRERVCEICSANTWLGRPLPLDLDHRDGNWRNNQPENLRYLCPNCHSQQTTSNTGKAL